MMTMTEQRKVRVWQIAGKGKASDAAKILGAKHHFSYVKPKTLADVTHSLKLPNEKVYAMLKPFNKKMHTHVFVSYDQNLRSHNMYRKPVYELAQKIQKQENRPMYFTANKFVYDVFVSYGIDVCFLKQHHLQKMGPFNHLFLARKESNSSTYQMIRSCYCGNNIGCIFYK